MLASKGMTGVRLRKTKNKTNSSQQQPSSLIRPNNGKQQETMCDKLSESYPHIPSNPSSLHDMTQQNKRNPQMPRCMLGRKLECSRSPIFHIMNVTDSLVPFQLPSDVKLLAMILISPKKAEGPNWTEGKG